MRNTWAAEWHEKSRLDGVNKHIMNGDDCLPVLFRTRAACRKWVKENYGYIKTRQDLRDEPHGWRLPIPRKVEVKVLGE